MDQALHCLSAGGHKHWHLVLPVHVRRSLRVLRWAMQQAECTSKSEAVRRLRARGTVDEECRPADQALHCLPADDQIRMHLVPEGCYEGVAVSHAAGRAHLKVRDGFTAAGHKHWHPVLPVLCEAQFEGVEVGHAAGQARFTAGVGSM